MRTSDSGHQRLEAAYANILVPNITMRGDITLEQFPALAVVEIDHFHAVFAQPVDPPGESTAFAHHDRTNTELPHQAAAIPAGSESGHHHQVAIAALTAGAAKGIRLSVNAGIALLHAAIVAAADQLALARKHCSADGNAAFDKAMPGFFKSHGEHFFVEVHSFTLTQRG